MLWWFGVGASVGVTERLWSGEGVAAAGGMLLEGCQITGGRGGYQSQFCFNNGRLSLQGRKEEGVPNQLIFDARY